MDFSHLVSIRKKLKTEIKNKLISNEEKVNAQIIHRSLAIQKNIWINTFAGGHESKYFKPAIYSLLHFYYNINKDSKTNNQPKVGDLYQKEKTHYKVIEVGISRLESNEDEFIKLEFKRKKNLLKTTIPIEDLYSDYVKIEATDGPNVGTKTDIRPLLDLMKNLTNEAKQIITFKKKFAIICSEKNFRESFDASELKAFPYEYITKKETVKTNFQFEDVQFYLAPDYETIQDHLLDNGVNLDLIVVIGNHKHHGLNNDLNRGLLKQTIFISNIQPDIDGYLKWEWTYPEIIQLKHGIQTRRNTVIEVGNELFEYAVRDFFEEISRLEKECGIKLNSINKHVSDLFNFVSPSQESEINEKLTSMRHSFERHLQSVLSSEFSFIGLEYEETFEKLASLYEIAQNEITFIKNVKIEALKNFHSTDNDENLSDLPNYVLIPTGQNIKEWKDAFGRFKLFSKTRPLEELISDEFIDELINSKNEENPIKPINIRKLKWLDHPSSILVFGLENSEFFKLMYGGIHNIKWIMYRDEHEKYKKYRKDYELSIRRELSSEDRFEISGIEYLNKSHENAEYEEQINETSTIEKLFNYEVKEGIYSYASRYDNSPKTIIYTNGSKSELFNDTQVVLLENDEKILCAVSDLQAGDIVRVYENQNREVLENILFRHDNDGKYQKILDMSSKFKEVIRKFLNTEHRFTRAVNLSLLSSTFDVSKETVLGWIEENSSTKFPQKIKNFEKLNLVSNAELNSIIEAKEKYNAIRIRLGRDLSSEVKNYLMHRCKGEILSDFDTGFIDKMVKLNMPVRTIEDIVDREVEEVV